MITINTEPSLRQMLESATDVDVAASYPKFIVLPIRNSELPARIRNIRQRRRFRAAVKKHFNIV